MKMSKIAIGMQAFALLCMMNVANAEIIVVARDNGSPAPGLSSFILSAIGTEGEIINSIAGLNIPGGTHNVTPAFGQPSTTRAQWDAPNGAGDQSWDVFDTHLLFNPSNTDVVVGFIGGANETNDGSDPAGLALSSFGQNATTGLGAYSFNSDLDQITVTPNTASNELDFLQVVIETGSSTLADVVIFDNQGNRVPFSGIVIGIPEPTSMALFGLGLVGLVAARRRRNS